ncbi:hypothetical protein LXL04_010281 [Taraxacum kok-saghyz]
METSALNTFNVDSAFTKLLTQIHHFSNIKTLDKDNAHMVERKDFVIACRRYSQDDGSIVEPPRFSSDNFSVWKNPKDMWDNLILIFEGADELHKAILGYEYECFTYKPGESLTDTYIRFKCVVNDMRQRTW